MKEHYLYKRPRRPLWAPPEGLHGPVHNIHFTRKEGRIVQTRVWVDYPQLPKKARV